MLVSFCMDFEICDSCIFTEKLVLININIKEKPREVNDKKLLK